ncbi:MAG: hypothetical protein C0522_13135 [Rhodocyclaceae bacterium]|jgi:hypothetical protein|nr:hypothetical protein [Rhodocyclaceae bacterium]
MKAIDRILAAYSDFPLRHKFLESERETLREGTIAQVSYKSESLRLMIKLFVSEMEHEGHIYIAQLSTPLGYRGEGGWEFSWVIDRQFVGKPNHNMTPIDELRNMDFFAATCDVQLRHELEWFALNLPLIVDYFNPAA